MKRYLKIITILAVVAVFSLNTGCEKLEVENLNQPDMQRVLSSPDDVKTVVQSAFLSYWIAIKTYNVGKTASVAADNSTVSWGNFAWRDVSEEPRTVLNNDPSYGDAIYFQAAFYGLYAVISQVNDALLLIENGMDIGTNGADNNMVKASAFLIRGMALGQLGLAYDKAMVPLHTSDLATLDFLPWNEVIEAAIEDLDRAIALADDNVFSWPSGTINGITVNNTFVSKLASSYVARFLTLGARTKAQNETMSWTTKYDWADVLTYANKGLTADFAPVGNGLPWDGGSWWDLNIKYLRQPGWGRVDIRIINMMDPVQPVRYPTDGNGLATGTPPNGGLATSDDGRLTVDFQFLASNDFRPERGGWHFTHYRHSRYDFPATTSTEGLFMGESLGPLRELRVWDNELMKAEALARTVDVPGAAAILNSATGPRKVRGGLADVPATLDDVVHAIYYERLIELFHNGFMIGFCETRRHDDLQYGTPLHWPVPGKELMALGREVYTFGGWANADGINTSNKGQWIWSSYHFTPPSK